MFWNRSLLDLVFAAAIGAVAACTLCAPATAQSYPEKSIRLVVGFAPGGAIDVGARVMAQKMSEGLGRPVFVENRTGAGGVIAGSYVAKAEPDGYTLFLIGAYFTVQPAFMKLPFDTVKDFSWISMTVTYPFVMLVKADDRRFATLAEFIAYARRNPGKINFPATIGSVHHFVGEMLNAMAGIDMTVVPVRGGSEPMTEVISGRQDMLFNDILTSNPHIVAGKVRPIAVTSAQPSPMLPNVPPIAQSLPGFDVKSYQGIVAPAGVPSAIIEQLNREVRRILELPDIRQRFTEGGGEASPTSPEDMRRLIISDIAKWQRLMKERKIEMK